MVEFQDVCWGLVSGSGSGLGFEIEVKVGFLDAVEFRFMDESRDQVYR